MRLEENYHDQIASFYNDRSNKDFTWEIPEKIFLLRREYFKRGTVVLDMGCGPAVSVRRILNTKIVNAIKYIGVDVSRELLKFAKKNIPSGRFIHADMATVMLPTKSADIILSLGALHHTINKTKTLNHWYRILKHGGYIFLREPIYEYLKQGTGESPIEEGIKLKELYRFVEKNKMKIVRITFFNTNAFHFFNKVMNKFGLARWRRSKILWYPIVLVDSLLANLRNLSRFFEPQAFAVVLQKS